MIHEVYFRLTLCGLTLCVHAFIVFVIKLLHFSFVIHVSGISNAFNCKS